MLIKDLIKNYSGPMSLVDVSGITCDSRQVKKGYAFVCIDGALVDGHKFAGKAVENGASVIVCERDLGLENQIICENTHNTFSDMCKVWFNNPTEKIHIIGVTGTNGKTTTCFMIWKMLNEAGHKTGIMTTVGW